MASSAQSASVSPVRRSTIPRSRNLPVTLAGMVTVLGSIYGFLPYLVIQLTVTGVSGAVGVWLFYVQHQFETTQWDQPENWQMHDAALHGFEAIAGIGQGPTHDHTHRVLHIGARHLVA